MDIVRSAHRSSPALMEVRGLNVSFSTPEGRVNAVKDVSFQIAAGEILAVVGESGSGKSVMARTLVGLAGGRAEVRAEAMSLFGQDRRALDLLSLSERAWRQVRGREIGFVLQDALVSLDPLRTVGREVAEALLAHGMLSHSQVAGRVEELLGRVGISDPENRAAQYPHELSGGLRQRALIASALAAEPRLLIADEPTTALDLVLQRQILTIFKDLALQGHAVLIITHDLSVAAQLADRVIVMKQGEVVEEGPGHTVLSSPRESYTQSLLAAVPTVAKRDCWLSRSGARPIRKSIVELGAPLLEVRDISASFRRPDGTRQDAVKGVCLKVGRGETVGVVGESGSGKTTLVKIALSLHSPDRGEVLFEGKPWSKLPERERRSRRGLIQVINQEPRSTFDPRYTVERIIQQPLILRTRLNRTERRARAADLMALVGLSPELLPRRPNTLSGGQRQRVSIAQALAAEPKLLICDEPVSALDVTTQAQVLDLLIDLQDRLGLSMVFISHDLGVVQHMSNRVAVMKDGLIVETGLTEEIFNDPQHPYTRDLIAAMPSFSWITENTARLV
ncbi:dipeptide ABC transporter ATP-binding protein [Rhizobium leguminosarum]|uniref:dipeptide ABC transporter ATP-binding protein n=1 Tax=Rhizobium leguminosarum TaxID=384 RepID=UPI003F9572DE